jgi:hypothetical protein
MIDPSEIVTNLVAMLRDIPALVTEVGGDVARIYPYHDSYPKNISLVHAIHQMPAPSIMAVWQGTGPGSFGGVDVWKHQITLFLRAKPEANAGTAYYRLFRLLTKGVPTAAGIVMENATVHPSCYAMDLPQIQRQTDAEALDYFEVPLSFTEIGDD